jgi:hypothetical protein
MEYLQLFAQLKALSIDKRATTTLPDSTISVEWRKFISTWEPMNTPCNPKEAFCDALGRYADNMVDENREFSYPIFFPESEKKHKRAILLLHGLNERSWEKYWTWAHFLCKKNGVPVILFPISFHMNRAPEEWGNPRAMFPLMKETEQKQHEMGEITTYLNFALSMRLIDDPLRFFNSGHQSALDIIQLTTQLQQGELARFEKETSVDFFAYSIGAFLAQILMVANPNQLFEKSRFFLFCGGALFCDMHGASKHILSKDAFERISEFYLKEIPIQVKKGTPLGQFMVNNPLGQAFYAMLSADKNSEMRNDAFKRFSERLYVLSLTKDSVIPPEGIKTAVEPQQQVGKINYEELDFPFEYTHEIPFPHDAKPEWQQAVNRAFDEVFTKAASFLL